MLRTTIIACALACVAVTAFAQEPTQTPALVAPRQETCGIFIRQDAEHVSYVPIPGYTILTAIPPLAKPAGQPQVDAIICDRESIFIGPQDYRVLTDLAVPLYIRNGARLAVLEVAEGQLRTRFLRGQPTPQESQALAAALDRAQDDAARARGH
jgi:hypothetical protein